MTQRLSLLLTATDSSATASETHRFCRHSIVSEEHHTFRESGLYQASILKPLPTCCCHRMTHVHSELQQTGLLQIVNGILDPSALTGARGVLRGLGGGLDTLMWHESRHLRESVIKSSRRVVTEVRRLTPRKRTPWKRTPQKLSFCFHLLLIKFVCLNPGPNRGGSSFCLSAL